MTDKERMEEIKEIYRWAIENSIANRIADSDIDWLINRVEELEEERDEWKDTAQSYYMTNQELREQNQRYKRALEEISNADWNSEGLDAERELDKVTDVAFKALEGKE